MLVLLPTYQTCIAGDNTCNGENQFAYVGVITNKTNIHDKTSLTINFVNSQSKNTML